MSGDVSAPVRSQAIGAITRDMRVSDILALLPECASLLGQYGLSCTRCALSPLETLAEGCALHGFHVEEIADLLTDLNLLLAERPSRPAEITVTKAAAEMLKKIVEQEGKVGWTLSVTVDGHGGFCMEFVQKPDAQEKMFSHEAVPDVHVSASPLTLSRIGGATIDVRGGRFKLDLPEDGCTGDGKCGRECGCHGESPAPTSPPPGPTHPLGAGRGYT